MDVLLFLIICAQMFGVSGLHKSTLRCHGGKCILGNNS